MNPRAEDKYEGQNVAPHRRRLASERKSLTYKFEIANVSGGIFEGYITGGKFEDGTLGELFVAGLGKMGSTIDGLAQWAAMDWSLALQHGANFEMMCLKHAVMKFEPRGTLINQSPDVPIPYCHSIPALLAEWSALRFGEAAGYPDLWGQMVQLREQLRSH